MKKRFIILSLAFLPLMGFGQYPALNWNDCPKNDIAHDQLFYIVSNVVNNTKAGRLNCNLNHDTISSIVYTMIEDTSGIFAIDGDSVYISDNTGLQTSVTYLIKFKVTDGSISDTANGYIYIFNISNGAEWNDNYSGFSASTFKYFNRGSSYDIDEPIVLDNDDLALIAIGNGPEPVLNCNYSTGSSLPFIRTNGDQILIYGLEFNTNSNSRVEFGNYPSGTYCDDIYFIQNRWIGSSGYSFYNVYRYDADDIATNHKILDEYTRWSHEDIGWYMNISGHEIIGCDFGMMGILDDPENYGSDGFQWAWSNGASPGFLYNEYRDIRYNRVNHSDYSYKHGFVVGDTGCTYHQTLDTIMRNKIIGPGDNGNMSYPFNGITLDGSSYSYVAENWTENTEHGLSYAERDGKHNTWVNNVSVNARRFGFFCQSVTLDSSLVINNTFIDPSKTQGDEVFESGGGFTVADTFAGNIVDISDGQVPFSDLDPIRMNNIYTDTTGSGYTIEVTEIVGDPLFTNKAGKDYTLQESSPAIDAGLASLAPVYDFAGNIRDATPDIGAYEYQGEESGNISTKLDGKYRATKMDGKIRVFLKPGQ